MPDLSEIAMQLKLGIYRQGRLQFTDQSVDEVLSRARELATGEVLVLDYDFEFRDDENFGVYHFESKFKMAPDNVTPLESRIREVISEPEKGVPLYIRLTNPELVVEAINLNGMISQQSTSGVPHGTYFYKIFEVDGKKTLLFERLDKLDQRDTTCAFYNGTIIIQK